MTFFSKITTTICPAGRAHSAGRWAVCLSASLGLLIASVPVSAHSLWMQPRDGKVVLLEGHPDENKDDAYDAPRVTQALGFDEAFNATRVKAVPKDGRVWFERESKTTLLAVLFDNGYWSESASQGWVRKPGSEVPDAKVSGYSHKYAKIYLGALTEPSRRVGHTLEIIPLSDPTKVKAGDTLTLQVLLLGQPLAGAEVIADPFAGDASPKTTTAEDGTAAIKVPDRNFAVVEVKRRIEITGDPKVNGIWYSATLGYTISGGGK